MLFLTSSSTSMLWMFLQCCTILALSGVLVTQTGQTVRFHKLSETFITNLKGHGNEADFLGFLQKLVPHKSLTLLFEPFWFWLRNRGDIRNRKTTPRLAESGSRRLSDLASRGVDDSPTRQIGESAFECFKRKLSESESRRLLDSASRGVANSPTRRAGESLRSHY